MIETEKYYYIYNRANGFENLFISYDNYKFFMKKTFEYLSSVLDIYVYCLMPNHFHWSVKIKNEKSILNAINEKKTESYLQDFLNLEDMIDSYLVQQFSNLFNSYSKAFNKQHKRHGSLFQKGFKRKEVTGLDYLQKLILYIHNNPTHHGFLDDVTGHTAHIMN